MIRKLLKHRVAPFDRHANGLPIGMLVCGRPGSDCGSRPRRLLPLIHADLIATR
jgi:hypothetical protein